MIKKIIKQYKEEIKNSINDLKHKDTFYKQIPNLLTFLRLIGGIPAGLMFYFGNPYIALSLIIGLWLTDAIDGHIARKYELQSQLGADMDAVADKIMFLGSAIPLITLEPMLVLTFILEGIIASINLRGRKNGLNTKTVKSGKRKTILLAATIVMGYLVKFLGLPSFILAFLTTATCTFQAIAINDYTFEFKKMLKEKELKKANLDNQKEIEEEENTIDKKQEITNSKLEELRKEKEFFESFKKEQEAKPKTRKRKKDNE